MTVITISRQFGSGGDEIAHRVCEILGYKQFDKGLIAHAAREAGLSEQEVVDFCEENHKIRSFLDRLFGRSEPIAKARIWREDATGARFPEEISLTEASAVALVQKAIQSAYQTGDMLIVGRGGQAILRDVPGVLHLRIEAPLEDRVQRVKQQMKQTNGDFNADVDIRREAQDLVTSKDEISRDYIHRYFQIDWADPMLYHLVLNTGKLTVEQAAQMIVSLVSTIEMGQKIPPEAISAN